MQPKDSSKSHEPSSECCVFLFPHPLFIGTIDGWMSCVYDIASVGGRHGPTRTLVDKSITVRFPEFSPDPVVLICVCHYCNMVYVILLIINSRLSVD